MLSLCPTSMMLHVYVLRCMMSQIKKHSNSRRMEKPMFRVRSRELFLSQSQVNTAYRAPLRSSAACNRHRQLRCRRSVTALKAHAAADSILGSAGVTASPTDLAGLGRGWTRCNHAAVHGGSPSVVTRDTGEAVAHHRSIVTGSAAASAGVRLTSRLNQDSR